MRGYNLRSFLLRQAGLKELCDTSEPASRTPIALIDGSTDAGHSVLAECRIERIGYSHSTPAADHATFLASILVANEAARESGKALGLCSGCTLRNFSVVTDAMLAGTLSIKQTAHILAGAVKSAVGTGCRIIVFGIELRHPESPCWDALRSAVLEASAAGALTVVPAGNSLQSQQCNWPGILTAFSCNWRGQLSAFCCKPLRSSNIVLAPGENVPGAALTSEYGVRSGTSFAAAIAAGAVARAACLSPRRPLFAIAGELCRPPRHVLDATTFQPKAGDSSCSKHYLPMHQPVNLAMQMHP
jgi:hypothetical protein